MDLQQRYDALHDRVEVLEERLRKRGTDSAETISKRLSVARCEVAQWKNFDYLLISDSIKEDLRRMLAIVEAEKLRVDRAQSLDFGPSES